MDSPTSCATCVHGTQRGGEGAEELRRGQEGESVLDGADPLIRFDFLHALVHKLHRRACAENLHK